MNAVESNETVLVLVRIGESEVRGVLLDRDRLALVWDTVSERERFGHRHDKSEHFEALAKELGL